MKTRLPGLLPLLAISLAATACITYETTVPSRRMEVDRVLARIAGPDSVTVFESLDMLAVAPDAESVYVLDKLARRAYRISVDGAVLATIGAPGSGPGELEDPLAIRADARGLWVLDSGRGQFLLFGPDGEYLEAVSPNVPWALARAFVPDEGGVIFPDFSPFAQPGSDPSLLARARVGEDGFAALDPAAAIPQALDADPGMTEMMERSIGWALSAIAPGEIALVLNRTDLAVWSVDWNNNRITGIRERRVPGEVAEAVRTLLGTDRPPPGAQLRPLSGVHSVAGRVWVMTGGLQPALLGFSVPPSDSMVLTVLLPGSLRDEARVRDGVVIGNRLIAITETEVL